MIVVAAPWEFGWNTPIKEYDLWHYPMREFGVDELAFTPISGIRKKGIREFPSIEELINYYDLPVIQCEEKGEQSLIEFSHPEGALYLFAKTSNPLLHLGYSSLKIETPLNKGMLWGHQAASIILYDRFLKQHGNNNSR